ncbi:MAG: HPF/RaiA family ribosome-associated protein [Lutibacter sp.]|jgi:ribosome-associated translation inhibitor RaiA|nr:HPF/RaiA family ribosome-associated protein [Lutibacter sp.]
MTIQINSDSNLTVHKEFRTQLQTQITEDLSRFSEHITRLEVHLSDENGQKDALNDKRCLVEARLEGMKPIAVTNIANNHEQAVDGAIDKLISTLETKFGRLNNH